MIVLGQPSYLFQYTYTYDSNGNITSKVDKVSSDTTTCQYDAEDRLVQVTTPTDIIQYQYDGFGRRNVRTLNGVATRYVYDQEDILFELDENEQIKARYTHGPGIDEPISVDKDTDGDGVFDVTYYYHKDGLGSITAITDVAGNVVQTYVYDAFGSIVDQSGSIENPYTYTSREWDAEAGLYYYRARYYDPTIGRFINGDPIGFAGGDVNFYVYVQNNPVNFIDPDGRFIQSLIAGGVGGGIVGGITFITELAQGESLKCAAKSALVSGVTAGVSIGVASTGIGFLASGAAGSATNALMQKALYGKVDPGAALYSGFATSAGGAALAASNAGLKGAAAGYVSGSIAAPVNLLGNVIFSSN